MRPPIHSTAAVLALILVTGWTPVGAQRSRSNARSGARPAMVQRPALPGWPDSAWRAIGPAAFGGRVDDIEAVADDPRIVFVGTASGGVFRSLNAGTTWEPVFDADGTALSIGDIAIAPSDRNIVWVGTGEANNRQSSTWGDGVYRSLDGGITWRNMGLRETQSIGRMVIDPRDPSIVFVAAAGHLWGPNEQRGLYRTANGGATWTRVLGVDANTGVIDVAMSRDGRTMLAATYERRRRAFGFNGGGPGSGLWRSLDGGLTWTRATRGLPSGDIGRIGVDISRSDPNVMYAMIESHEGGVFRSTDAGATWTRQNRLAERGSYYGQIRVDPTNPDRVWVLGTDLHTSIDGGKTFTSDSIERRVHPDNHALWIDPAQPQHMLLGNDGGVFVTYDGAWRWDYVDNLPIGQFYDIAVDAREPYWIYGGTQDNGTFAFPSGTYSRGPLTDREVTHIEYGDGFQVAADPTDPRLVYTNSQNGRGYVVDLVTREERRITPLAPNPKEQYRFNWNTAILLSPNDPHIYYYGANRLLKTADHGTTWQVISPDLTRHQNWRTLSLGAGIPPRDSTTLSRDDGTSQYGNITTIAESPRAAGTLYVGTDDGNVQMTTDGGVHWADITARFHLAGSPSVSKVVVSSHDVRTAYVTFDGHTDDDMTPYIFRTTDGGTTWRSISGGLPTGDVVKTLTEDPRNPDVLFAGTEFGLYYSLDAGRHWTFPGGTLPRVVVDRVLVNTRNNDLILGTHGRSVYILDDIRALEDGDPARDRVQLSPLRDVTTVYQWRDQPLPGERKFTAPNTPIGALITYYVGDSARGGARGDAARIRITASDGSVVRELAGPATPGMHRVEWDLRRQFAFVPAASDSGFYGAPRAPFVMPGTYTVTLTAAGASVTQPVVVRSDPRAITTPEALRARNAMALRIDSLASVFADAKRRFLAADTEYTHIGALLRRGPRTPTTDTLLATTGAQLGALRRAFGEQYGTTIGEAFDLLGGLESSSATPTDAERRTLELTSASLAATLKTLAGITDDRMPRLRAALARPAPAS